MAATVAAAQMHAGLDHFAVALLDLHLPDGTPFEVARDLERAGCRIALVSGADVDGVPAELGHHTLFQKPVTPVRLADWVDAMAAAG
jgi:CheY-like chemotaxis protein